MSDRWAATRAAAGGARAAARALIDAEGFDLVAAALAARGLDLLALAPADPLLRGARAVYDVDYVAFDASLPRPEAAFALAHELGHAALHAGRCACAGADIDAAVATGLLAAAPAVEVYNPRQAREGEANAFAVAFLLPPAALRARFLAGDGYGEVADHFGVTPSAALHALADALLQPIPSTPSEAEPPPTDLPAPLPVALDASQAAAARAVGPTLVVAGPGSGKTATLVGRVLALLEDGAPAHQILAVTFSNRAAREMRARLQAAAPDQAHALTISTLHALGLELLRRYHAQAGLPADVAVLDTLGAIALLERHLDELDLVHYLQLAEPTAYLGDLLGAIARAKDELAGPARYAELADAALAAAGDDAAARRKAERWAEVARVYAVYERLLRVNGLVDFGDLIARSVALLDREPWVREQLRAEYRHFLVDEYQDMNRASAELLRRLAGAGAGLWVVGDLRQAIYRFRGAEPAHLTRFADDYPGGQLATLGVNYRADPALVRLVGAAADAMPLPAAAAAAGWRAERPAAPGPTAWLAVAEDGAAEAAGVAAAIRARRADGRPYREQAVLARTNRQAGQIVDALERAGVPALYLSSLFGRPEVRDLLALAALAAEGDPAAFLRIGGMAEHALPRAERARLVAHARARGVAFPRALALAAEAGLPPAAVAAVEGLRAAIDGVGWQQTAWGFLARYLFGHGALVRRLLADGGATAARSRLAIGHLLAEAQAADRAAAADATLERGPRALLAHARRLVAHGEDGPRPLPLDAGLDAVAVLTVHAAKGLEFPVVYVPNLAAGRFPTRGRGSMAPPPPGLVAGGDDDDEEARLFFVAISRARDELVLSRAERYGKLTYKPSPFLGWLEDAFAGSAPVAERWPAVPAEPAPEAGVAIVLDRPLELHELEQYRRCPRMYEYGYRLGLPERDEALGYRRFHDAMREALRRLTEARRAGATPTATEVEATLAAAWADVGPVGHPYEALYRALAGERVARGWAAQAARPAVDGWPERLEVPLAGATVRLRVDDAEPTPGGGMVIRRRRAGRRRDEDARDPRLALLRAAARRQVSDGAPVTIALEYLATGETEVVPEVSKQEAKALALLGAAVEGIRAGRFPARPADERECATCPYWVCCPS